MNEKNMTMLLDAIGRTIIGERKYETDEVIGVKNPAIVNVVPQQGTDPSTGEQVNRMALQLFPLVFKEFLADKEEPLVFEFNKNNVTLPQKDVTFDFKMVLQYEQLFANAPQQAQQAQQPTAGSQEKQEDNTIKLFDQ